MMERRRSHAELRAPDVRGFLALVLFIPLLWGCPPRAVEPVGAPISQRMATGIVNHNIERVTATLRAGGKADGHFTTPDGDRRSFSLDVTLFFLPPMNLRADFESIAQSELLVGSNDTHYWLRTTRGESWYACRRHDSGDTVMLQDLPVRPDQLIEALGLTPIPTIGSGDSVDPPVLRVVDEFQQLLFVVRDDGGRARLEKEYWLDRRPPRLVRRVVFRNPDGVLEMAASLDRYRRLIGTDLQLPHRVTIEWPANGSKMDISVNKWRFEPRVTATGPQFVPPHVRGLRFDHEDIED